MTLDKKNHMKRMRVGILLIILGLLAYAMMGCQPQQPAGNNTLDNQASSVIVRTVATINGEYQEVAIDLKSNSYGPIVVQKGIPVKFNIRATEDTINGCNNTVVFNDFKAELALKPGDNIVEFTPNEVGSFQYDCWMGMIYSTVKVVDDISVLDSTGN